MKQSTHQGFAMLAVIGVVAILFVFMAAAATTVQVSYSTSRINAERLNRIAATRSALALASLPNAPDRQNLKFASGWGAGKSDVHCQVESLASGHEIYSTDAKIQHRAGDRLVTIQWATPPNQIQQFLVNTQQARAGALPLPANP